MAAESDVQKVLAIVVAEIDGKPCMLQSVSPEWDSMPLIPNFDYDNSLDPAALAEELSDRLGIPPQTVDVHADLQESCVVEKVSASSGTEKTYEYIMVPVRIRRLPDWLNQVGEPDQSREPQAKDSVYYTWWPLNELKELPSVQEKNAGEIDAVSKHFGSNLLSDIPRSTFDSPQASAITAYIPVIEAIVAEVESFLRSTEAAELARANEHLRGLIEQLQDENTKLHEQLRRTHRGPTGQDHRRPVFRCHNRRQLARIHHPMTTPARSPHKTNFSPALAPGPHGSQPRVDAVTRGGPSR